MGLAGPLPGRATNTYHARRRVTEAASTASTETKGRKLMSANKVRPDHEQPPDAALEHLPGTQPEPPPDGRSGPAFKLPHVSRRKFVGMGAAAASLFAAHPEMA